MLTTLAKAGRANASTAISVNAMIVEIRRIMCSLLFPGACTRCVSVFSHFESDGRSGLVFTPLSLPLVDGIDIRLISERTS